MLYLHIFLIRILINNKLLDNNPIYDKIRLIKANDTIKINKSNHENDKDIVIKD